MSAFLNPSSVSFTFKTIVLLFTNSASIVQASETFHAVVSNLLMFPRHVITSTSSNTLVCPLASIAPNITCTGAG